MKKGVIFICLILLIFVSLINLNILLYSNNSSALTGAGITASVALTIAMTGNTIYIDSPLNQTYNFGIGDDYTLEINVSSDFNASLWYYSLWDRKHNIKLNDTIAFSPNITFNAVRWSNELIVHAINGSGDLINQSVGFYVNVSNSAPYFGAINSTIHVCENSALSYYFNVTDVDEQVLQLELNPASNYLIPPIDPFYIDTMFTSSSVKTSFIELFSGVISADDATNGIYGWKVYDKKVEVTDQEYSDTVYTNITAIEINDVPAMSTIGVQTVYTHGENSLFYKQVQVSDEEDGNQNSTEIDFNISFWGSSKLFGITEDGVMIFNPDENQTGVYTITVCANDTGIDNPYAGIGVCGQDGGVITTCQNFSLTVTDDNRAPTITSYAPTSLTLNASGQETLNFNLTKYDPDGTIPDTYWYVDGVFVEYDSGSLTDSFNYAFACGVSGTKTIEAEVTDGLSNDSVQWTVAVSLVECPVAGGGGSGGGGGGGGGGIFCSEKWVCSIWGTCQSASKSLEGGLLSGEDYREVILECSSAKLSEANCGVQSRFCFDNKFCNTTYLKPLEFQSCHYTEKPSCSDGIKNCHDYSCELLVDCGGPCSSCPSCSDKIQNQNEEGVDCGGPCPWKCEIEQPLLKRMQSLYVYLLLLLLIILIILVIIRIRRIFAYKRRLKDSKNNTFK